MGALRKISVQLFIALFIVAGAGLRTIAYGDFRLSIANPDTGSYIGASRSPILSWKIFAGKRLLTTNLIYKLANDPVRCPPPEPSNPALGSELPRQRQACFENITLLQNVLSLLAWSFLAWTTSRWLQSPELKISSVVLILGFAYTPQIAEWDYVLDPQSLTLSLLVISFALLQEVSLRIAASENSLRSRSTLLLITAWAITFFFWVFIRDVHLYVVLVTLGLLLALFVLHEFRQSRTFIILAILLVAIFIVGSKSATDSLRATNDPLIHSFEAYIYPFPSRVSYMKKFGMPELDSPELESWLDKNATQTFGRFLISHPGFVFTTVWDNFSYFEGGFEQAYFPAKRIPFHADLLKIGQMFHPETVAIYLIDFLILAGFVIKTIKYRTPTSLAWTWLATWFFLSSVITLGPSFFGDTVGLRRHIFPSVEMFRLFLWLFLLPHLDNMVIYQSLEKAPENSIGQVHKEG